MGLLCGEMIYYPRVDAYFAQRSLCSKAVKRCKRWSTGSVLDIVGLRRSDSYVPTVLCVAC